MGIESFNRALAYMNDMAQFGVDVTKKSNGSTAERLTNAGTNLFGNMMSSYIADSVYDSTGSSSAYLAKYAAGSDPQKAMKNTMQAGMYADMLYNHFWGCGGCYGGCSIWNNFGGMYSFNHSSAPGFSVFDRHSFFRY